MTLLTNFGPPSSPARTRPAERPPLRVGLVQERWHEDADEHLEALRAGIRVAAAQGARLVCLQELTLTRYFALTQDGPEAAGVEPEELENGPTVSFLARLAAELGIHLHGSLYERAEGDDGLGYNTAVLLSPRGRLVQRTRKLHIPVTAGYHEDLYFRPGPGGEEAYRPVRLTEAELGTEACIGLPTCWDQWFPEVARAYGLAGAEIIVYPTAIGSEPDHPDFDTEPLWQQVIVAGGIANGTFMVAINRIGEESGITFYGSSFISDPYGRVLVQAPRDEPAVLVADLELDQRRDWLELFPFYRTRRPETYGPLLAPLESRP